MNLRHKQKRHGVLRLIVIASERLVSGGFCRYRLECGHTIEIRDGAVSRGQRKARCAECQIRERFNGNS
jgi:hypothetical protein